MVDLISYKVESSVDFVGSLLLSDEDLSTQAQSAINKEYEACQFAVRHTWIITRIDPQTRAVLCGSCWTSVSIVLQYGESIPAKRCSLVHRPPVAVVAVSCRWRWTSITRSSGVQAGSDFARRRLPESCVDRSRKCCVNQRQ